MRTSVGIRVRCVSRREVVVELRRGWLVLDILWPVLLRILLAMSILCHALWRWIGEGSGGTVESVPPIIK
jgi:hypothetical protein